MTEVNILKIYFTNTHVLVAYVFAEDFPWIRCRPMMLDYVNYVQETRRYCSLQALLA